MNIGGNDRQNLDAGKMRLAVDVADEMGLR
jgi:hypothetical protein